MRTLLFAASLSLVAAGAARAEETAQSDPPAQDAPSPSPMSAEEALRCGAWAAIIVGASDDNEELQSSYGMAMAFFLGRFEGAKGQDFGQPLSEVITALDRDPGQLAALDQTCPPRMMDFGNRLTRWGDALKSESAQAN